MNNRPSTSKAITLDEYADSGNANTIITTESVKEIHVAPNVDKSIHFHVHPPPDPGDKRIDCQCKHISGEDIQPCEDFERKLRQLYRNLVLPKLAWLEKGSNLSIDEHFIRLELQVTKKPIEVEDIFKPVNDTDTQPLRILIEGQPGFGKTTLATKVAYDWAIGKTYVKFKFVLFVPLRELQQASFESAIEEIGKRCDFPDSLKIFNSHKKNILVIFDGLDELSLKERMETLKLLYKQNYSDVTVLVFCRTGLFELSGEEKRQLFGSSTMKDEFCDKRISIMGVGNEANKRLFLKKFLDTSTIEDIIIPFSLQRELFDSPLLLMALAVLIQEGENIEELSSTTEFYKRLINCILKHSHKKRGCDIESDYDLFKFTGPSNDIQKKITKFGKLAAKKIVKSELMFESDVLTDGIYELGLLINHKEMTLITSKNHYEALHLHIVEFVAAFGFWMDLTVNKTATTEDDLKPVMNHYIESKGTSQIMPLLASLMGGDLDNLLALINSYSVWFVAYNNALLDELVSECSSVDVSKSKRLGNFISPRIESYHYMNGKRFKEIVECGIECGRIKSFSMDGESPKTVFEKFTNEIGIQLILECKLKDSRTEFRAISHVPCQPSKILSHPIPLDGPLGEWLNFAALSDFESCVLKLTSFADREEFLRLIANDHRFSKIHYHLLETTISTEWEKQTITSLLENNQVIRLDLTLTHELDMKDFAIAAGQSSNLTCIKLKNVNTIDLYDLTDGGKKEYNFIKLDNIGLTCRQQLTCKNFCRWLQIDNFKRLGGVVCEIEPSMITYRQSVSDLMHLVNTYPRWFGFKSIITLETDYHTIFCLHDFKNLQTLYLRVLDSECLKNIAIFIHSLPIVNLAIENEIPDAEDLSCLFKGMNAVWARRGNSKLKTITLLEFIHDEGGTDHVFDLLKGLENNHWDKVNLGGILKYKRLDKLLEYMSSSNLLATLCPLETSYFEPDPFVKLGFWYEVREEKLLCLTRKSKSLIDRCLMS